MLSRLIAATSALVLAASVATAQDETEDEIRAFNAQSYFHGEAPVPDRVAVGANPMPTRPAEEVRRNTMMPPISAEAKMKMMQTAMAGNVFSLRDMMNFMVAKKKVLPGISFDDVIESLNSKAFDLNMRPTGHNTPWSILRETFDPNSPRLEFLSFCDLITMRMILDYSLEFGAFVPCRITVAEDADGQIWLYTLDWDIRWLDTAPNPNRVPDELRERAIKVRENLEIMMEAAANGDF
jgi:uncharacterized protein (DUF302 family)